MSTYAPSSPNVAPKRPRVVLIISVCIVAFLVIAGGIGFAIHSLIESGITKGPDNLFGDQHLKTAVALIVQVSGQAGAASPFEEETHTLAISAHGALIAVAAPMYRGQLFNLSNIQTKAALECVVVHVERISGEQSRVGVEFMLPNPTFWRVAFPPKDWTPRHPDAKSG